jgi:single-stranded-DNA-specific exonuclease
MNKKWVVHPEPPQQFMEEHPELLPIVARLLYHRNIRTQKEIDEFLNPDYERDIYDPFLFQDMEKAVTRIFAAIEKKESIVVHGDYDADGVSASTILVSTLRALGSTSVDVFLPHREIDGYGLNMNTVKKLSESKVTLLITCDCGISNTAEVTHAKELGIDTIITDHHAVPEILPPAVAIIHPKVEGEPYPDKHLAGGGVAFKLVQALMRKHKEAHPLLPNGKSHESHEKWLLDMVAIASVADMIPLIGESRTLTKYGLIVLNHTRRLGLQKLLLEARFNQEGVDGKKKEITTETIGFQIAPRINAAGRMNHAKTAFNLMITERGTDAVDLAFELNNNNTDRQKVTEELVKESIKQVENNPEAPVLVVHGYGWSPGVVGLIASRLKEKYQKPTIACAETDGEIVGSGRSIDGFNMIETLQEMPHFFHKFGGHPMACGFTIKDKTLFETFKNKLCERFLEKTKGIDLTPSLGIDAKIELENIDWELYDILDKFKPFGVANDKPKYLAEGVTIHALQPVGKDGKHLRIMVKHKTHKIRKTIGWSLCSENSTTNWCKILKPGDKIDIVFEIDVNEWNGNRELQLTIVDLRLHTNNE